MNHSQGAFLHKGIIRRLEMALYHAVTVPLVSLLPASFAYGIACLRGDWCYRWDMSRRAEIMRCLEKVLGDQLSPAEQAQVTHDYFRHRSCLPVDVMRMAGSGSALSRLVKISGLEHIEAALAHGKGAILCSGHFGSYDSCFSLFNIRGFPITVVGRWPSRTDPDRSPLERFFFRQFYQKPVERHRQHPNIEPRKGQIEVAVQIAATLRRNELIGVLLDPPVVETDQKRAVEVNFLNRHALLMPGAITIARLTGAPVLMVFLRRSPDWKHQMLEISPPILLDGDTVTAFHRCLSIIEEAIRRDPAHWRYWSFSALTQMGLLSEMATKVPV